MKILFIRHGETTGDVENRYGGNYDDHLSEKGVGQSKRLAEALKDRGVEVLFSSPLLRAQETAKIIAQQTGSRIATEAGLRERNQYGKLTGMTKEEAKKLYPEQVELLKDRLNTIDEAESYEDFSERIAKEFERLTENTEHKNIAIVSHGGPLRVLFRDILKWGELKEIGDCSFVELEKRGNSFSWIDAGGLVPEFQIPDALANEAMDRDA
jgi:broad specificity phosphatase PhoE